MINDPSKTKKQTDPPAKHLSTFMCIGMAVGLAIGAAVEHIPIGMCLGMAIGMLLGASIDSAEARAREILRFEPANDADIASILNLYTVCATPENCWSEHYPNRETLDEDMQADGLFVLRDSKGGVAACISLQPHDDLDTEVTGWQYEDSCVLGRFAVDPARQGQGVGRRMIKEIMALARSRGYGSVRFLCNVGNEPALRLYDSMGFRRVCEINMYTHDYYAMEAAIDLSVKIG